MTKHAHLDLVLGLAAAAGLSACASVPDVKTTYYLPKASTTVTVTQSVLCDEGKEKADEDGPARPARILVVNDAAQVTNYVADTDRGAIFEYRKLDGAFSDSSSGLTTTEDGRLKGFNATTSGKGDEVVKAAIVIAEMVLPFGATDAPSTTSGCGAIAAWGGGKPVALTYEAAANYAPFAQGETARDVPFVPDPGSKRLFDAFFGEGTTPLILRIQRPTDVPQRFQHAKARPDGTAPTDVVPIWLPNHQAVKLEALFDGATFWSSGVTVPSPGKPYYLPVPKSALFGKQSFTVAVSDAGQVTSLSYAKDSGLVGSLGAAGAIGAAVEKDTDAEQAAKIKSKADILAQQQRLLICQKEPANCKTS